MSDIDFWLSKYNKNSVPQNDNRGTTLIFEKEKKPKKVVAKKDCVPPAEGFSLDEVEFIRKPLAKGSRSRLASIAKRHCKQSTGTDLAIITSLRQALDLIPVSEPGALKQLSSKEERNKPSSSKEERNSPPKPSSKKVSPKEERNKPSSSKEERNSPPKPSSKKVSPKEERVKPISKKSRKCVEQDLTKEDIEFIRSNIDMKNDKQKVRNVLEKRCLRKRSNEEIAESLSKIKTFAEALEAIPVSEPSSSGEHLRKARFNHCLDHYEQNVEIPDEEICGECNVVQGLGGDSVNCNWKKEQDVAIGGQYMMGVSGMKKPIFGSKDALEQLNLQKFGGKGKIKPAQLEYGKSDTYSDILKGNTKSKPSVIESEALIIKNRIQAEKERLAKEQEKKDKDLELLNKQKKKEAKAEEKRRQKEREDLEKKQKEAEENLRQKELEDLEKKQKEAEENLRQKELKEAEKRKKKERKEAEKRQKEAEAEKRQKEAEKQKEKDKKKPKPGKKPLQPSSSSSELVPTPSSARPSQSVATATTQSDFVDFFAKCIEAKMKQQ